LESRCQTLLTFAPSFPTRPDLTTLLLAKQSTSLGVVQRSPSVVFRRGVHSRAPSTSELVSDSLREERASSLPCSVLTVSHRLDGFLLHPMALRSLRAVTSTVPTLHAYFSMLPTLGFTTFPSAPPPPDPCEPSIRAILIPVMLSRPSKPSPRTQQRWPASRRGVTTSPSREDVTTTVGRPTASSSRDVHRPPCPPTVTAPSDEKLPSHSRCCGPASGPCSVSRSVAPTQLPAREARCSHGLVRSFPHPPAPVTRKHAFEEDRPYVKDRS